MGFNKRTVTKFAVMRRYNDNGISEVKRYLKADALFPADDLSRELVDKFNDGCELGMIKLLEDEQSRLSQNKK